MFHASHKSIIRKIRNIASRITFLASIFCLVALTLFIGLFHTETSLRVVRHTIYVCQCIFILNIVYNLLFSFKITRHNNRTLKWILDILVLFTAGTLFFQHQNIDTYPIILKIYFSNWFVYGILALYSVFEISYGIARLMSRKTNPSLILAYSFVFFILIGTLVLMLPKCTHNGISFIDSLFVATSAVSITGLTTVDIASVFTPLGIIILAVLIQIGALGVLTFTSFFALFFTGESSIYNQLMVRDMVYSKNANALLPTLLYVFIFTLTIEIIGSFAIYFTLPSDFPIIEEKHKILFAAFQSLSAFCNAGFTWVADGMSNTTLMQSNQLIYIVMGTLVILGGIGFPILVNFKTIIFAYINRLSCALHMKKRARHRVRHIFDVNTKIVLITTLLITIVTICLFLLLEWNNSLEGMTTWKKIVQAYFNSSIPRSSGFASVNPAGFLPSTLLLMMFLMWIGGSSQSTAGGVKVNTFAAMLLNLKSIITDRKYITVFNRTISVMSVRRANAVIALSVISYFALTFLLVVLEPEMTVKDLAFESASALFTVGSSLGITPALGTASKIILCVAMFTGRVGLLSFLMGLSGSRGENKLIFPYDNIIIN